MVKHLSILAVLLVSTGCLRLHPQLEDLSVDHEISSTKTNITIRKITTKLPATAWFSSAQAIAKFKALQTDKTQSLGGEGLNIHGATNSVAVLDRLLEILKTLPR